MVKIRHVQLCQPTRFPDTKLDHFQYFLIRLSCLASHHCNKRHLTKNQSVFEEPGNSEESYNTTLLSDFMLNLHLQSEITKREENWREDADFRG